jgi:hypothetical protein
MRRVQAGAQERMLATQLARQGDTMQCARHEKLVRAQGEIRELRREVGAESGGGRRNDGEMIYKGDTNTTGEG